MPTLKTMRLPNYLVSEASAVFSECIFLAFSLKLCLRKLALCIARAVQRGMLHNCLQCECAEQAECAQLVVVVAFG